MVPPGRLLYELCGSMVRGEIPVTKFRSSLEGAGLLEPNVKDDIASILADVIAHMGLELSVPGESRTRLVELAKWLEQNGLVPMRFFQERCEAEFLSEAEFIKIRAADLKAKEVRVNTRLLYQQTKFNLVKEESEGYAKLLTALSQSGCDGAGIVSTIKSLIGHFDLDPNRVLDLVLEYYELYPENPVFSTLIPLFPKSHVCHILGFKFQYYQRNEVDDPVPVGLFRLAARLVKADFVSLESIYAHLLPKDEDAIAQCEEVLKRRLDEANKIGKINLAATGKDLMEEEKSGDVTVELHAAIDSEAEAVAERAGELLTNQKLGLLNGFLAIDDWPHAHILFERLAALNPVAHEEISSGLIRLLGARIAPHYDRIRPQYISRIGSGDVFTPEPANRRTPVELRKEVFQMISWLGPYLYRDVLLLQKLCKVLKAYYQTALGVAASTRTKEDEHRAAKEALKDVRLNIEDALGGCILPSLQLSPSNPAICTAIWEVMSMFPYEMRYRLYGEWEKEDETLPMLLAARQIAKLDTRRILKRLAKENLKQLGRMLAKVAHANPMTVIRTTVIQIEAYKDMIAPVVDAFKYLTQLGFDVLEYVVLERLALKGREKLKDDGLNLSDWLQSLASFWGHLCKKYPSMELRGLLQYIVNQLKEQEGIELIILQELMQQMANIEYTENVTDDQIEAMSGGDSLRYHATGFGLMKGNKALSKSSNRLKDALVSKDDMKLAVPLLILISHHRSRIINKAEGPYIKTVSEQYDRGHGTLLQYVEFLTASVTPTNEYAKLVPSLEDLVHKYHIEPEVAFLIYRPILGLLKSDHTSGNGSQPLVVDLGPQRKALTRPDVLTVVQSMLPPKAWLSLSPELYLTFWELSLQDLYVPKKKYEAEIAKQRSALKLLEESSDNSSAAIARKKKEKEKVQEILDRLTTEMHKQEQTVAAVHQRLLREKDSWLTSCSDSSRIYIELLQRCIFPRCVFSMIDAVYCAKFVQTLHSLGTPLFNTVNHIDSLMCKTLQPMISCCTEYEAGRLGRFLLETLKMMYHWKSDEGVYERECINMPGFGLYYRNPNSPKVTFEQYLRVQIKWNSRLTKLMIQCLESPEYMEIRNALTVLTKISSVFPATKKTGVNIEKRVSKIKQDEREDLKVLATGVSAALASRKSAWVTDDEFVLHRIDAKAPSPKPVTVATVAEAPAGPSPAPPAEAKAAKSDSKPPVPPPKAAKPADAPNGVDVRKEDGKPAQDEEARHHARKAALPPAGPSSNATTKPSRPESIRDAAPSVKPPKPVEVGPISLKDSGTPDSRTSRPSPASTASPSAPVPRSRGGNPPELSKGGRNSETTKERDPHEPSNQVSSSTKSPSHRDEDRPPKRSNAADDSERLSKRRKESVPEVGEIRNPDRWSSERPRSADYDKPIPYDDRGMEKQRERQDREYRADRSDRNTDRVERDRNEEYRDRPGEKIGRDRSSERGNSEYFDRLGRDEVRPKEDRGRPRPQEVLAQVEERFGQSLPPPPPIPPNVVPHSISGSSRREEDERRGARSIQQRLSPHRDEKRRMDDGNGMDDLKRRRDDDRKMRDERDLPLLKVDKDRERERMLPKEDVDLAGALSKRRRLKRDHLSAVSEAYLPPPAPLPPPPPQPAAQAYDRDRKAGAGQARNVYLDMHPGSASKDGGKIARRDQQQQQQQQHDPLYDREREWEEDKRQQRGDMKRRHHSSRK